MGRHRHLAVRTPIGQDAGVPGRLRTVYVYFRAAVGDYIVRLADAERHARQGASSRGPGEPWPTGASTTFIPVFCILDALDNIWWPFVGDS